MFAHVLLRKCRQRWLRIISYFFKFRLSYMQKFFACSFAGTETKANQGVVVKPSCLLPSAEKFPFWFNQLPPHPFIVLTGILSARSLSHFLLELTLLHCILPALTQAIPE
ncbi:hypothetical protein [Paucimonas lemoignei]|uniref:hypothetical protein n=1 Tax=Paucimonas lemoignei TaxID=29443 RepID=UPI001053FEE2|nr:hypothetical protein [Paucimonas lemoignei]